MILRCFALLLSFSLVTMGYGQSFQTEFHIAEEGQTLYSIARMYDADVHQVMDCNKGLVNNGLSIGDTVLLDCAMVEGDESFPGYHRVKQGETLYSIATMYGIAMDDIMRWNNLISSKIDVNQKLKVAEASSQVNIEWTERGSQDSISDSVDDVGNLYVNGSNSNQEHLFSISKSLGGELSEGKDTFYIVDYLSHGYALCSSNFSRYSSVYESLGIAAVSTLEDTSYQWVDLEDVCFSSRHEISRALAETLQPLHSEDPNPWIVLSWQLVVLERTLSEE